MPKNVNEYRITIHERYVAEFDRTLTIKAKNLEEAQELAARIVQKHEADDPQILEAVHRTEWEITEIAPLDHEATQNTQE